MKMLAPWKHEPNQCMVPVNEQYPSQLHLDRKAQFEKLFKARLRLVINSHHLFNDEPSHLRLCPERYNEVQLLSEIQRSPDLSRFVFGDFLGVHAAQSRHQSMMDVLVRAVAVVPMVLFLPMNLRKVSIARALCLNQLYPRGKPPVSISSKRDVFDFVADQIAAWKMMQMALPIVVPLLVQFIGHHLPSGNATSSELLSPWSGFVRVFGGMDFYREMSQVIANPRRTLQLAVRKAEEETGNEWSLLSLAREVEAEIDPRLHCLAAFIFENLKNSNPTGESATSSRGRPEDELIWRMYRTVFKLEMAKTVAVCKDWLTGGVKRRVAMLNERFYSLISVHEGETVSIEFSRLESTQRLVVLYLTGVYKYVRQGRRNRASSMSREDAHLDDDQAFVESLFRKRVSIVHVTPA